MTDPDLKVTVDRLRDSSRELENIASGYFNDGSGPILKSVTRPVSGLDVGSACAEVGDALLARAQTLGEGVDALAGKFDSAATLYQRGDTAAAEAIDFDPPEAAELEAGDDPGEPGYDPVNEYEEALHQAGLLQGKSEGLYREWLQNAVDNGVPPEVIVDVARQQDITPDSFDVLDGTERITDDNLTPNDPTDDKDYFLLPENATPEQARQAALMAYVYNAGTGYGTARGSGNNDFAETPYSANEIQRIRERQAANAWSYDLVPEATSQGGRFAATPNGMLMGVGGGAIQQTVSAQAGTCVGDVFAVNYDTPPNGAAQQLRDIIRSGDMTWQDDAGRPVRGLDLDRVLHHEERHSQQWADLGFDGFLREYYTGAGYDQLPGADNPFEVNAGHNDGGYH
ncbi:MAG: ESX-1 secretion-associated protein [Mycobacterium sp.]